MMRRIENPGVLPDNVLWEMLESGVIKYDGSTLPGVDPSMMDLTLSANDPILAAREEVTVYPEEPMTFRLNVASCLPPGFHAFADAKTRLTRPGISVAVYDEHGNRVPYQPARGYFDDFSPHPNGDLYAKVIPRKYPITVRAGCRVANLRVFHGDPADSRVNFEEISNFIYENGAPIANPEISDGRLIMRLNLKFTAEDGVAGYVSRRKSRGDKHAIDVPAHGLMGDNLLHMFLKGIPPTDTYLAQHGRLSVFYTAESLDMRGNMGNGGNYDPFVGFMRRSGPGRMPVCLATMLEAEPGKQLTVEIIPERDTPLTHGQSICYVDCYNFAEPPSRLRSYNEGNCSLSGPLFKKPLT
jgi:hypothetical protein